MIVFVLIFGIWVLRTDWHEGDYGFDVTLENKKITVEVIFNIRGHKFTTTSTLIFYLTELKGLRAAHILIFIPIYFILLATKISQEFVQKVSMTAVSWSKTKYWKITI